MEQRKILKGKIFVAIMYRKRYNKHIFVSLSPPDWAMGVLGRASSFGRNRFILDLDNDDVCDYIIKKIKSVL